MRRISRAIIIRGEQLLVIKRNKNGQKFFTLPGGEVDENETNIATVVREVKEEASIECRVIKGVYQETAENFGETTYFLCEYISGEPKLGPNSFEALETSNGQNTYTPMWLEITALSKVKLLPTSVAKKLEKDLDSDFEEGIVTVNSLEEEL